MTHSLRAELDELAIRIGMHVSRAQLIESVRVDEVGNVDPDKSEPCMVGLAFRWTTDLSEIISDYLDMLQKEAEELRNLVDELNKSEMQHTA